jgi:hypothetical protein
MYFDFVSEFVLQLDWRRGFVDGVDGNGAGNGDRGRKAGIALVEVAGDTVVELMDALDKFQ